MNQRQPQKTLKNAVRAIGIGIHSGEKVFLNIQPAPVDTGIVFRRMDLHPYVELKAHADLVRETSQSTTLIQDGVRVATIEHLLSAIVGLGLDNLIIELNSPEVPIMDGSAAPFVYLLQSGGVQIQSAPRKFLRIKEPVILKEANRWARFDPYDGFKVRFDIEFKHPLFATGVQSMTIDFQESCYIQEISRARTFGFLRDIDYLRANNLALGGSLDNAVVLDDYRILNPDGLRYQDELVRHKILDAIGDIFLMGYPMVGAFTGYKSGHALNNQLVRQLLDTPDAWEIVTLTALGAPQPVTARTPESKFGFQWQRA